MSGEDRFEAEGLGRLNASQTSPIHCVSHVVSVGTYQRIDHGKYRNGARRFAQRGQQSIDDGSGMKRRAPFGGNRLQAGSYRRPPRRTAG